MRVVETPQEMRALSEGWRASGEEVGLVPTMGALHEGHLSLVRRARSECGRVVVSVFVNPTQFGRGEDFETYPRRLQRDRALLDAEGVDAVFSPTVEAMYGEKSPDLGSGERVSVDPGRLGTLWEGEVRPGHFRGVATVVAMLFHATLPHRAYFGEKDYQQLKVIQKMARELLLGVEVVGCPTVRDPDGLAGEGERSVGALERAMREVCEKEHLVELQYAAVVDPESLRPLEEMKGGPARAIIAARVGGTHLIDNAEVGAS